LNQTIHKYIMNLTSQRLFSQSSPPSLDDFHRLCSGSAKPETYPLAASIEKNVPIYNLSEYEDALDSDEPTIAKLQDEWYHILLSGPGVFVLKGMYTNGPQFSSARDRATRAFERIISHEKTRQKNGDSKGDHFAGKGANERIWNSFGKHAIVDPASFCEYYSNPWLSHVCNSWLGPAYRVTAQVNVVKPQGKAQNPHRDYHLGFQDQPHCAQYPRGTQVASQFLTLQGAVAHTDMPLASGPTRLLPFSQRFEDGYLAYREDSFQEYFLENYVALPLEKGDGIFFNPALFHAAGANETADFNRMANLLQISSAFGKAMEAVDSLPIVERCWDILAEKYTASSNNDTASRKKKLELSSLVQAIADGYPFPTNLDNRPPAPSGMAPESEQQLLVRGLEAGWTRARVVEEMRKMRSDAADVFEWN
jgi:ectoine hydroxylase-related dioxygenase (phytanoyl-CoA dioxygenase family)